MNVQKLYNEEVGRSVELTPEEQQKQRDEALLRQSKLEWLSHPRTKDFHLKIEETANLLDQGARDLAKGFDESKKYKILELLVRSDTLRTILKDYGNGK